MIELFHDYTAPASAVAVARLHRLMREGLTARIHGTEVLGLDTTMPVTLDLLTELDRVRAEADAEQVDLHRPRMAPPTGLAHVVEDVAGARGLATVWRDRCYRAYWSQGADIGDAATLRRLAADAGLPADAVRAALEDRVALLAVRRRAAGHRRDGIGGVPTIRYGRTLIPGLLPADDLRALAALSPPTG